MKLILALSLSYAPKTLLLAQEGDSVRLLVAESDDDFTALMSDEPRT